MSRIVRGAIVVWLCLAANGVAVAQDVQTPERAIQGQYIVVLDDQQVSRAQVRTRTDALVRQHGGVVLRRFENALRGFSVAMSATAAAALARKSRRPLRRAG